MSGNVWEWCSDRYGEEYYMTSRINNPQGPSKGTKRVLHGGSALSTKKYARIGNRVAELPNTRKKHIGFRLVHP
jgi:formylglycine-generating enzyme required for sulfatase activity